MEMDETKRQAICIIHGELTSGSKFNVDTGKWAERPARPRA